MANFILAYNKTLGHEGGYCNIKEDRGGETYKGVARNLFPNWEGWEYVDKQDKSNVKQLEQNLEHIVEVQDLVKKFYKNNFWDKANLDLIDSQIIAEKIYDIGVNQGIGSSVKYFQKALNLLNNQGKHFPNIVVDGGLGKQTLTSYEAYMQTANKFKYRTKAKNENLILVVLRGYQFMRYEKLAQRSEDQEKFMYGWLTRLQDNG